MSSVHQDVLLTNFQLKDTMDVALKVPNDDREVPAHRKVLMGASEFFATRFKDSWTPENPTEGKETVTVDVAGVTYETLDLIVTFIYTNKLEFTPRSTVRMAILAADYLLMTDALKALSEYVASHMKSLSICDIYPVANKLAPKVASKLRFRVQTQLEEGTVPEDIGLLDYEDLLNLIRSPWVDYHIYSNSDSDEPECQFYRMSDIECVTIRVQAIQAWLNAKPQERQKDVLPLLASIAFIRGVGVSN